MSYRLMIPFALLMAFAGCEETNITETSPTGPSGTVFVSIATNCAPTTTAGEIRITDASGPSTAIDRVSGNLFNATGADVCAWSISRAGNLSASETCRGLTPGNFTFTGNIILNTGQSPTQTTGSCSLPE